MPQAFHWQLRVELDGVAPTGVAEIAPSQSSTNNLRAFVLVQDTTRTFPVSKLDKRDKHLTTIPSKLSQISRKYTTPPKFHFRIRGNFKGSKFCHLLPPAILLKMFWTVGCIYGASSVMLGAFGAHGLKKHITDPARLANWSTAAQYQVIISLEKS